MSLTSIMPLLAIFDETDRISCICLHVYADGSLAFSNARFTTPPVDVTSAAAYVTCVCIDWHIVPPDPFGPAERDVTPLPLSLCCVRDVCPYHIVWHLHICMRGVCPSASHETLPCLPSIVRGIAPTCYISS